MRTNMRHSLTLIAFIAALWLFSAAPIRSQDAPTDTPTDVPTDTLTPTYTDTAIPTDTPTDVPSDTPTDVPTDTIAPTETPTLSETPAPTATETPTETIAPTATPTLGDTATETLIPPGETATETPTATETSTLENSPTPSETPTPTPLPPEPPVSLLFADNFDSGPLPVWTFGAGWTVVPSENGQALQVTNSDEPTASETAQTTLVYDNLWNLAADARFQINAGAAKLTLRQSAVGDYSATLDANGQVSLTRGGVVIASAAVSPSTAGQWRTLRLSVIEGVLRVAVDGVEVIALLDDAPLPPGQMAFAGVGVGASVLLVDDVEVWLPSSDVTPSPTPTDTPTETATATPTPLPPEPVMGLVLSDDFRVTDLGHWKWTTGWSFIGDAGGMMLQVANSHEPAALDWGDILDVAAEVHFQIQSGGIRLSVRQSAVGSYSVVLDGSGLLRLYRGEQELASSLVGAVPAGQERTLRLSAIGSILRVAVDGVQLTTLVDDNPLPAGGVTMAAEGDGAALLISQVILQAPRAEQEENTAKAAPSHAKIGLLAPSARQSPAGNRIVFVSNRDGDNEIYLLDRTACNGVSDCPAIQLTCNTLIDDIQPDWSPDGSQIVFTSTRDGNYEIYKMSGNVSVNCDPNNVPTRLTNNPAADQAPTWSSNGSQIAFERGATLTLMDANGGNPCAGQANSSCTLSTLSIQNPEWSPDGSNRIVFAGTGSATQLYFINLSQCNYLAASCGNTQLTFGGANDQPHWSPNGNWIAYNSGMGSIFQIYVMDVSNVAICNSAAPCPIYPRTTNSARNTGPSWSPDSSQIVFSSDRSGNDELYVIYADGVTPCDSNSPYAEKPCKLTINAGSDGIPEWDPPPVCDLNLTNYATIPVFADRDSALTIQDFIQSNSITGDGLVSRLELQRIRDKALFISTNLSVYNRYRLDNHVPGFVSEPSQIQQALMENSGIASAQFGADGQGWFGVSYGILNNPLCGVNAASLDETSFAFDNDVFRPNQSHNDLFTLLVDNRYDDGLGNIITPPISTVMNLSLLRRYIAGQLPPPSLIQLLVEYTNAKIPCAGNTLCVDRVQTRMMVDAQNRFDEYIIVAATVNGVPPLIFKTMLLQESALIPGLTPNRADAAGIAQFVAKWAADDMVNVFHRAPAGVTAGNGYLAYVDGITGTTAYSWDANHDLTIPRLTSDPCQQLTQLRLDNLGVYYPTAEAGCVDFDETQRAIRDGAFYLHWEHDYLQRQLNNVANGSLYTAWQATAPADRDAILWPLSAAAYNTGVGNVVSAMWKAVAANPGAPLSISIVYPFLDGQAQLYVTNTSNGTPGA